MHIFGYDGNSSEFEQSACMGGQPFQPMPADSSPITNEQDQVTLVARGQQNAQVQPLSQTGVIASSSENLFQPISHDPPSYVFKLPNVPLNPCFHAYNPLDTFQHPVPYRSPFSSYNNPAFRVPSNPPCALYNQVLTSPVAALLPQPSSVPHIHSHPVFSSQPQFHPAYNHTPPIFNQPQMTHNLPPVFNQPKPTYNLPLFLINFLLFNLFNILIRFPQYLLLHLHFLLPKLHLLSLIFNLLLQKPTSLFGMRVSLPFFMYTTCLAIF